MLTSLSLSALLILGSCTTTLMSSTKQKEINSVLAVGNTYTFIKADGSKEKFMVLKIEKDKISGKNDDQKSFEIEKSQISEIKKGNTLATVGIIVGAVALITIIPAFVSNKPVGQ